MPGMSGTPNNLVRFRRVKSAPPLFLRARKGCVFLDGKVSGTRDDEKSHRWESTDVYGGGSRVRRRVARATESLRDRLFKHLAFPRLNQIVPKDSCPNRRGIRLLDRKQQSTRCPLRSSAVQRSRNSHGSKRKSVECVRYENRGKCGGACSRSIGRSVGRSVNRGVPASVGRNKRATTPRTVNPKNSGES